MPLTLSGNGTISDLASVPTVGGTALPTNLSDLGIANHDQITVDSSGRVTNSNPIFSVYGSPSSYGGGSPQTGTAIIYGGVLHNVGGHYNTSTGVFTAPVAGTYIFQSAGYWPSYGERSLAFFINGGRRYETYEHNQGGNILITVLSANDTVISSFGNAPTAFQGTGDYWHFGGYLIG